MYFFSLLSLAFIYIVALVFFYLSNKKNKNFVLFLIIPFLDLVISQIFANFIIFLFWHKTIKNILYVVMLKDIYFLIIYSAISLAMLMIYLFFIKPLVKALKVKRIKSLSQEYLFFSSILMFCFSWFLTSLVYLMLFFPFLTIDQIAFTLTMPLKGTNIDVIVWAVILLAIIPLVVGVLNYLMLKKGYTLYSSIRKSELKLFPHIFKYCKRLLVGFIVVLLLFINFKLNLISFIKYTLSENQTFYEENYIDPKTVNFTFPKRKRNLILIYIESMEAETSFCAKQNTNLIPELTKLANENISFSHNNSIGGQKQLYGTGWTMASIVCSQLGVPLTLPLKINKYQYTKHFFNGAYGMGDLLKDNGYNLSCVTGGDKVFSGMGVFFKTHGNIDMKDLMYYRSINKFPKDSYVWWGIEDKKVFEFAKEDILEISSKDKPFMEIVILLDTHHPKGYKCENCQDTYSRQIHNVFRCESKQVYNFVSWIKKQDFYENTAVILLGDHLYMGSDLYETEPKERHAYNTFINTNCNTQYSKNRDFATFDLFPTIVEALGISYDAKGLGLGRSLFSGNPTLLEQLGEDKLNDRIRSKSSFYRNQLLNKKEIKQ